MKILVTNPGPRAVAIQSTTILETIHPKTERVIEVDDKNPMTKRAEVGLIARGVKVEQVDDDTPVTPVHEAKDKPAPVEVDKGPTLDDLKAKADEIGLTYGAKIGAATLQTRIAEHIREANDAAAKELSDLKARATELEIEHGDEITSDELKAAIAEKEADAANGGE